MLVALAISCGNGGASGRKVEITQTDRGCTPSIIAATAGEKLDLVVKNASGTGPYRLERVSAGYSLPAGDGTYTLRCYVLGGVSTTVHVVAGKGAATESTAVIRDPTSTPTVSGTPQAPDATIAVKLIDYSVTPDRPSVPAGTIRFDATNASAAVEHEFVVHRLRDDGSGDFIGEVEDIHPGKSKTLILDLTPGTYRLACFIVTRVGGPGPAASPDPNPSDDDADAEPDPDPEAGSANATPGQDIIDHYRLGMHALLRVD
jgi:uncharacterized cupredoxin-like copper-binding protein